MAATPTVILGPWMLMLLLGGGGFSGSLPPLPEDPTIANVAPADCLAYATWSGTAEVDPNSSNSAEQLLAEPEIQALREALEKAVAVPMGSNRDMAAAVGMMSTVQPIADVLTSSPTAIFVEDFAGPPRPDAIRGGLVCHAGDDIDTLRRQLERLQASGPVKEAEEVTIAEERFYRLTLDDDVPAITWGTVGQYLIVAVGEGSAEAIIERMDGSPPEWLVEAKQITAIPRRAAMLWVDVSAVVRMIPDTRAQVALDRLGLENVEAIAHSVGLDDEGCVSKTAVVIDGEPIGLLALANVEPLTADDLADIPADATLALAVRFDADRLIDVALETARQISPQDAEKMAREIERAGLAVGIDIRRDLLQALGDRWCVYNAPSQGGFLVTGLTAVVSVDDPQRVEQVIRGFRALVAREAGDRGPTIDAFDFGEHVIYTFNARDDDFPLAPSWCLAEDKLIVAANPQNVKAHLVRTADDASLASLPVVANVLEEDGKLVKLVYVDTQAFFDVYYAFAPYFAQVVLSEVNRREALVNFPLAALPSAKAIRPHLRPSTVAVRRTDDGIVIESQMGAPGVDLGAGTAVGAALLLPAVHSARRAARDSVSINNLKQIMLALHNYHDTHRKFPASYSTDDEGTPLLSWRVHVLPYVGQSGLYDQFHLDEPWDSEHNRQLIQQMPPAFRSPHSSAEPGKTTYLAVRGEDCVMEGDEGIGIAEIRDGTSNTIAVVEVDDAHAEIWTKPADFEPNWDQPFQGLAVRGGSVLAAFCDGSVQRLPAQLPPEITKNLFRRSDGNVVPRF